MSSRVQKGGTLFKPVAKSRARAVPSSSRQQSVALDSSTNEGETRPSTGPSVDSLSQPSSVLLSEPSTHNGTMAPPLSIPQPSSQRPLENMITIPSQNGPPSIQSIPIVPSQVPARASSVNPPSVPLVSRASTPLVPPIVAHAAYSPQINVPRQTPTAEDFQNNQAASVPVPEFLQGSSSGIPIIVPTSNIVGKSTTHLQPLTIAAVRNTEGTTTNPALAEADDFGPAKKAGKGKAKRKRTEGEPENDSSQANDASSKRSRSRASSATPRPRKRAPSPPPYDPNADPGEDIDPTTMTMASLCVDTGQGRVSSKAAEILNNHATWKLKNREKRARMRALMEAQKYGRPTEDENDETTTSNVAKERESTDGEQSSNMVIDETGSGFDYTQDLTNSRFNVQVRIGPNGETIIDEESLVVDRAVPENLEDYTHVIESDHTKFVNSGTYGKRYRGSRWSAEETEMFYDALAQYGENYELIAYVLPGRDRKSCKNKFKMEDKKNPGRINHCLNNRIPVDIATLARVTGKDFSGPTPEIRAPAPPAPPPPSPPAEEPESAGTTQARGTTKRSRSKSAAEAGVIIVGNTDLYAD